MSFILAQKPVVHTEHTIQRLLVHYYYSGCKYLVPNIRYSLGEADLLIIRRSGYVEEFEIKITTSDFRADSKKYMKHNSFVHCFKMQSAYRMMPNKFSYVVGPTVNYSDFEIPSYYGLYVANRGLRCIKPPTFIHKTKFDWTKKIAGSCSFKLLRFLKLSIAYEQPV